MDFLRPRAVPALIAALAAVASHAACEGLNGKYRYEAAPAADGRPHYLSVFARGRDILKVTRQEGGSKAGFASSQPMTRPRTTHLSKTGTLVANARGGAIEYRDAQDKPLATIGIGEGWRCRDGALEREAENIAGLGDNIRTERVQERLSKAGDDLLYTETVTVIDPPGGKPKRSEVRVIVVK